jgi:hypothetical protein
MIRTVGFHDVLSMNAIYLIDIVKIMGVWVIWSDEFAKFKPVNYIVI